MTAGGLFQRGRMLSLLIAAGACCALLCGGSGAGAAVNPALRLVLTPHDLGHSYRSNQTLTGPRTLADISLGDSRTVRRELARSWLGGEEDAYNGVSVPWGVVSISDVFKPTARIDLILAAWEHDLVTITKGKREPLPAGAPGSGGALVRGSLLTYELLIYMWRRGRTIASVDVTGSMGTVPLSLLMKLARRQDAKIIASSFG